MTISVISLPPGCSCRFIFPGRCRGAFSQLGHNFHFPLQRAAHFRKSQMLRFSNCPRSSAEGWSSLVCVYVWLCTDCGRSSCTRAAIVGWAGTGTSTGRRTADGRGLQSGRATKGREEGTWRGGCARKVSLPCRVTPTVTVAIRQHVPPGSFTCTRGDGGTPGPWRAIGPAATINPWCRFCPDPARVHWETLRRRIFRPAERVLRPPQNAAADRRPALDEG